MPIILVHHGYRALRGQFSGMTRLKILPSYQSSQVIQYVNQNFHSLVNTKQRCRSSTCTSLKKEDVDMKSAWLAAAMAIATNSSNWNLARNPATWVAICNVHSYFPKAKSSYHGFRFNHSTTVDWLFSSL